VWWAEVTGARKSIGRIFSEFWIFWIFGKNEKMSDFDPKIEKSTSKYSGL